VTDVPVNLRRDAFAGAAEAYAQYRPPYPPRMLADLLERAGVPSGDLLDLATGPGRIALDLAGSFERVVAIDLEPDMIAVARAAATRRGIENVTWHVGRAEDLDVPDASFDLITIGEAFHRLEQAVIAQRAMGWLRPGGCLATLGTDGRFSGDATWQASLREVRDRWLARSFPDGVGLWLPARGEGQEDREATLRAAGFVDVDGRSFEEAVELDFDAILGFLSSTSVCSKRVLGPEFDAFEAELRAALEADGTGRYPEMLRLGYTLARKPR
jgi:SAM-dependent methyltransferase